MKTIIYAIAKNEEHNVRPWLLSIGNEVEVYVLDTGSSDNTVRVLKEHDVNVHVFPKIPFRFDVARNYLLKLLPTDVDCCVFLDLDERLSSGWLKLVHVAMADPQVTAATVKLVWSRSANGQPAIVYDQTKIHRRHSHVWRYPIHEVLVPVNDIATHERRTSIEVRHCPTDKDRDYLQLLESAVLEYPNDERMLYYLAREKMYVGQNTSATELYLQLLDQGCWVEHAAEACTCLSNLTAHKEYWLIRACAYCPNSRDSWYCLAQYYYNIAQYKESHTTALRALAIDKDNRNFIRDSRMWLGALDLLCAQCAVKTGQQDIARVHIERALEKGPTDPVIIAEYVNITHSLPAHIHIKEDKDVNNNS